MPLAVLGPVVGWLFIRRIVDEHLIERMFRERLAAYEDLIGEHQVPQVVKGLRETLLLHRRHVARLRRHQRNARFARLALLIIPKRRRDEMVGDFHQLGSEVRAEGAGRIARVFLFSGRFLLYAWAIVRLRLPDFSAVDSKENEGERERETR